MKKHIWVIAEKEKALFTRVPMNFWAKPENSLSRCQIHWLLASP